VQDYEKQALRRNEAMKRTDFYYRLPEELIAQNPIEPRDSSRLLVVGKQTGGLTHSRFYDLADYLKPGDLLILNDSKVFPARLLIGDAEILLLEQRSHDTWECIGRKLKVGRALDFGGGLTAEIISETDSGNRIVRFGFSGDFFAILDKIGHTPLPHYITEALEDSARYNTIYANEAGSAAAPTAGLHFTDRVFGALAEKGVETAFVTLHVGLGTFRPVKADDIAEHVMHSERYWLPAETAQKIADCKARGNRVIAVGTTACRTLEASGGKASSGSTDIFIYPGYDFGVMDGLLTNFHLPESTLIMLVSAFLGREKTLAAYEAAIAERYRFYSFGDSMLII
jgi:S-adenosylmethionine:tRNA ribosyltransferase-isomerase